MTLSCTVEMCFFRAKFYSNSIEQRGKTVSIEIREWARLFFDFIIISIPGSLVCENTEAEREGFIWRQKRRFEKPMILSLSLSFSRINWRIEINPASHPTNRTPFFSPFSGEKEPRVKGIRPRRRISSFFLLGFIEGKEITRQFLSRIYSTNKKKNRKKRKEIITIPRHFDMERFSTVIHYNGMNGSEWW